MTNSIRTVVRKADLKTPARAGGVIAAVAAIGLATAACGSDDAAADDTTTTPAASAAESAADTGTASAATGEYKNGTYSATGSYNSPGGEQHIGVTVTLDNSTITEVSLDTSETKGTSAEFQGKFASGIDSEVVGKNIDDLDVSKVAGSSLTSGGFNQAIEQIKTEAKS